MTRTCLYEAANALMTRNIGGSRLRDWALAIAKRTGPRKAKVALARKLAVMHHAMWRTGTPFEDRITARCQRTSRPGATERLNGMRPAGTHGKDEIAPGNAAALSDRAHHFDPSDPKRQHAAPLRQPRREPCDPARIDQPTTPRLTRAN
jgi:hypothetical protein